MATTEYHQLETYPAWETTASSSVTFTDLLVEAAKAECVQNITVSVSNTTRHDLEVFKDSISIKVLHREEKPTAVGRAIVDISVKEYKNYATEDGKDPTAGDNTKMTVTKNSAKKMGRDYQFTSTQGLTWDMDADIGLKILAMGMGGGSIGLGGGYGRDTSKAETLRNSMQESLGFEYSQEETVCVPSGKKVQVTVATYAVQYQQRHTLEFSVPKSGSVFVSYKKPYCCGLCTCKGFRYIPFSQIVRSLSNFREDHHNAYFTQEGFLSWIGESCEVEKEEASVHAS